jgi:hypothetical protein
MATSNILPVDPDDKNYIVWDITSDLTVRATTALAVSTIVAGVTVLEAAQIQGSLIVAKVTIDQTWVAANASTSPSITARVICANTEQFDRTIKFALEDH